MDKAMIAALKALLTHVSKDVTRPHLRSIYVRADGTLDATDGHRLLRVRLATAHGLPEGFYDAKASLARIKANLRPEPRADMQGYTYPDFEQVIPRNDITGEIARMVAVNPSYLSDAADALAKVTGASKPKIQMRLGTSDLDPIRLDATGDLGTAIALVMPMRA